MARAHVALKHMNDSIISTDDPTAAQAMEALASWEQESASATASAPEAGSANQPNAPATDGVTDQTAAKSEGGDARATEATTTPDQKQQQQAKPTDPKASDTKATPPQATKYEKAQQRMAKTWDEVNKEKDLVRQTAEGLKQRETTLAQRERQLAEREAKLNEPRYKPEDYENHAAKLEAEARKQEDAGEFTKADRLRYDAEKAREYATQLRQNPPKSHTELETQRKAEFEARQKEWWGKAAVDFPGVVKDGSPERTALLKLLQDEKDIVNDPKGMYYACRLVSAETSAARVPTLEKDLAAANARVKELEQLTSVPADGSVPLSSGAPKTFEQMTPAEQMAALEAEARSMS